MILPIIMESIKDEDDDERRYIGVVLVDELSEALGVDLLRDHIMYEFISMQDDPVFKIRREIAMRLLKLSKVLGDKIFVGVIIPVFKKLSQDSIWSVRKACVEVLPKINSISNKNV